MLGGNRDGPQCAAKGQRSGVAHKDRGGGRVIPQKAQTTAKDTGGKDQNLARARHIVHVQIFGEIDAADGIGDHAKRSGGDHHGHDRQPVQPVRQVHRIRRPHDHDDREGHEQISKVDQRVLEHGQCQLVLQLCRVELRRPIGRAARDDKAQQKTHSAGNTSGRLLADLGVVIGKPDGGKCHCHQQHHPDKRVVQPRPQQGRGQQGPHNQQPAHGRRPRLDKMPLGTVIPDRLALALPLAQHGDQRLAEQKAKHQRCQEGPTGAEGDVAEKVKEIAAI